MTSEWVSRWWVDRQLDDGWAGRQIMGEWMGGRQMSILHLGHARCGPASSTPSANAQMQLLSRPSPGSPDTLGDGLWCWN